MGLFNINKQSIPTPEDEYNKIFAEKENEKTRIIEVDIDLLDDIKDQPFKFRKEKAEQLVDSIKQVGVLEPIICRAKKNGRYDIIAGRHRRYAAKEAGLKTVPVILKDVSVDTAKFILLTTNTDRNNDYSYSELAYAYKEQMELLEKLGNNAKTSKIAESFSTNRKQIYRYIRLTHLSNQLLKMVDNGQIPFTSAVDFSYFSEENQNVLFRYLLSRDEKMSVKQGKKLKDLACGDTKLTQEMLDSIFTEPIANIEHIKETDNNESPIEVYKDSTDEQPMHNSEFEGTQELNNNKVDKEPTLSDNLNREIINAIYNTQEVCEYYIFEMPTSKLGIKHISTIPIVAKYDKFRISSNANGLQLQHIETGNEYFISTKKIDLEIRRMLKENLFDKEIYTSVLRNKLHTLE